MEAAGLASSRITILWRKQADADTIQIQSMQSWWSRPWVGHLITVTIIKICFSTRHPNYAFIFYYSYISDGHLTIEQLDNERYTSFHMALGAIILSFWLPGLLVRYTTVSFSKGKTIFLKRLVIVFILKQMSVIISQLCVTCCHHRPGDGGDVLRSHYRKYQHASSVINNTILLCWHKNKPWTQDVLVLGIIRKLAF